MSSKDFRGYLGCIRYGYVMHALWVVHAHPLRPVWRTHCVWRAPLALFLLYRELFSDRELFNDRELREARTKIVLNTCDSFSHIYLIDLLYKIVDFLYKIVSHTFWGGGGYRNPLLCETRQFKLYVNICQWLFCFIASHLCESRVFLCQYTHCQVLADMTHTIQIFHEI